MDPLVKINVGGAPNDGTGDELRDAFIKVNKNTDTLVAAIGVADGLATLGADGRLTAGQAPIVTATLLPTGTHDLNTYTVPGSYYQGTVAAATLANNYPVANVTGFLAVDTFGTATYQQFNTRNAPYQQFWRVRTGTSSWSAWKENTDTTTALIYYGRIPTGADLNNYANRGMWAINAASTASGGTNFPIANSGWLLVYCEANPGAAAGTNVNQVYIGSNGNRQFFRSLVNGVWSAWEEVVRSSLLGAASGVGTLDVNGRAPVTQFPYSAILAAGVDANTLATPGLWHVNSDANATTALNWPVALAGTLLVEAVVAGNQQVTQVYTTRTNSGIVRRFVRVRFTTSLTWSTWQEIPLMDATNRLRASNLPAVTESLWNGTTLTLGAGGLWIEGNFDGQHSATTASFRYRSGAGAVGTYVPIVPPPSGTYAGLIVRTAASLDSAYAMLGATTTGPGAEIVFSRHGTGTPMQFLRFQSFNQECGRIKFSGQWNIGPYGDPENESRVYVRYTGGGSQHGILLRPTTFADTVVLNFLQANGVGSGSITMTTAGTTFYNTSSDYRLKEHVADTDVSDSLVRVCRVHLREFKWKMDGSHDRGSFAHELAEVFPRAVTGEKDAVMADGETIQPQGVDWSKLVPDLVGSIQAQQALMAEMRAEIDALKSALPVPGNAGESAG